MSDNPVTPSGEETLIPFDKERYDEAKAQLARIDGLLEEAQQLKALGAVTENDITNMQNSKQQVLLIIRLMEKRIKVPK